MVTVCIAPRGLRLATTELSLAMPRWRPGPRDTLVLAVAIALAIPATLTAQTPSVWAGRKPIPSPVVVDAQGRVVGAAFGFGVRVQVDGRPAQLEVGQGQFLGGAASTVFESDDCSGPAFLRLSTATATGGLQAQVAVGPPSLLLGPGGPPETRTIRSAWAPRAAPPVCIGQSDATVEVVPAEALMDLGLFTPPFRIE